MIEIQDLVFEYPTKRALHGVSVTIEKGAIAALVGPNGAGKTTLMRCIAALERPYSGHVRVDGLDVTTHPRAIHKKLGFLADFYGLYDDLTVARALTFAAKAHGMAVVDVPKAVEKAARRVGLSDRMNERAAILSRGLRQRLAIGQAVVHEPAVLLLDEPASGLDPDARRELSALLRELQAQGMTLVVSSHILSELEDYSTEMIIMSDGHLVGNAAQHLGAGETPRLMIELAAPSADLASVLGGLANVTVLDTHHAAAVITFAGTKAERAGLLKTLVDKGFPVISFSETKQRLQDVYFEKVEAERRHES